METLDERAPRPPTAEFVRTPPTAERHRVDHDGSATLTPATRNRRKLHRVSLVVLVVGLVVTGMLTASSRLSYLHDEQRLSNLQTNLTASALGIAPVDLERRLGQAAAAAGEASDPVATFRRVIASLYGSGGPICDRNARSRARWSRPSACARWSPTDQQSNWKTWLRLCSSEQRSPPRSSRPESWADGQQRFGYLMSFVGPGGTYVASAGQDLPSSRRIVIPSNSPDAGLNIAIYFGKTTSSAALIETNVSHLPLDRHRVYGRRALRVQRLDPRRLTDEPADWTMVGTPSLGHSRCRLALHRRSGCNDRAADPATSTRRTTRRRRTDVCTASSETSR